VIVVGKNPVQGAVTPTGNRVLLSPKHAPEKSKGGIILPGEQPAWERQQYEWVVLAVGPGEWRTNKKTKERVFVPLTDVVPGDFVLCKVSERGYSLDDGSGRWIVDFKNCDLSWKE
jgi:co-chaperonin GroES (HSP10)